MSLVLVSVRIMFLFLKRLRGRVNPLKELEKAREDLRIAYIKLLAAKRLTSNPQLKRSMLMVAVLTRSPLLMPDIISRVYIKGCVSDLRRISKRLKKLVKHVSEKEFELQLEEVIKKLDNAEGNVMGLALIILEAEKLLDTLINIISQ